ncbi:MAG: ferredoxin--NADP reductase [Halobacteriaceae archaeon]
MSDSAVNIRDHKSQHETAEELPLISDSATITKLQPLDHNRVNEIQDTIEDLLTLHEQTDLLKNAQTSSGDTLLNLKSELDDTNIDDQLQKNLRTLLDRYERPYPSLLQIRFDTGEDLDFVPGQYVTIRYQKTPRPYSISNSPNEDETEICVRRVPNGRLTTKLYENLETGDTIAVRGPNGEFVLQPPSQRSMVFVATGTGVAPLKSMIEYTFETGRDKVNGQKRDVWLILGASWLDDLPYHDQFMELADNHSNFHYIPTLSREELLSDWEGETNYVQYTILKYMDRDSIDISQQKRKFRDFLTNEPRVDISSRLDPNNCEVYE